MRFAIFVVFALIFGIGVFLTGEGLNVWYDTQQHKVGECQIVGYKVKRSEVCTLTRKVIMTDPNICREGYQILESAPCRKILEIMRNHKNKRPLNSTYVCYYENSELTLYDRNYVEIKTQIWLGILFMLWGSLIFWVKGIQRSLIACTRCKKHTVTTKFLQIRSGGEEPTPHNTCHSCGIKWKSYD